MKLGGAVKSEASTVLANFAKTVDGRNAIADAGGIDFAINVHY